MNKQEVFARLKKLQLLERLSLATETNPEAATELSDMEHSPEDKKEEETESCSPV